MNKTIDTTKRINKAYTKYRTIDTVADLKRNKLTLDEYKTLTSVLDTICNRKSDGVWTFKDGVADWCRRNGLIVTDPHGDDRTACVNYWISAVRPADM